MPHKTLVLGLKEIQEMLRTIEPAPPCQILKPAPKPRKRDNQWKEVTKVVELGKEKGLFWESNEMETPLTEVSEEIAENQRRTWNSPNTLDPDEYKPPTFPRKP